MSDPINTTSGLALDGLTRLEILQELRQQAWLALNENAAQGGINVEKLGEYIRYLSTDIDKLTSEKAEKLKAEEKARFEAEMNTVAGVSPFSERTECDGDTATAGPFAKREEHTPKTGDTLTIVQPISSELTTAAAVRAAKEYSRDAAAKQGAELNEDFTMTIGGFVGDVDLTGYTVFTFTATKK